MRLPPSSTAGRRQSAPLRKHAPETVILLTSRFCARPPGGLNRVCADREQRATARHATQSRAGHGRTRRQGRQGRFRARCNHCPGLAGGIGMALWQMIDSGATSNGFWTPLNLCMASFVWRGQAAMIERDMMMHPGMSMNMPVAASHVAVGMILHLAFSMVVGMVFITVLVALRRAGVGVLRTVPGYVGAAVAGAALLYVVMIYLVLPWANPLMCHMTPRGPFFVGHLIYGLVFGLVAYPLARRAAPSGT